MYTDLKERVLTILFVIGILLLSIYTNHRLETMNEQLVAELSICKKDIDLYKNYLIVNDFEGYEELTSEANKTKGDYNVTVIHNSK